MLICSKWPSVFVLPTQDHLNLASGEETIDTADDDLEKIIDTADDDLEKIIDTADDDLATFYDSDSWEDASTLSGSYRDLGMNLNLVRYNQIFINAQLN